MADARARRRREPREYSQPAFQREHRLRRADGTVSATLSRGFPQTLHDLHAGDALIGRTRVDWGIIRKLNTDGFRQRS